MMYTYMRLSDETEITHSELIKKDDKETIEVHFERPTEDGFDIARCVLPDYKWVKLNGYSKDEINRFEEFLHCNAHLLFKYAVSGGVKIA